MIIRSHHFNPCVLDDTPVDLTFIDADKGGYRTYLDLLLPKLADYGMIVVDHVVERDDCDVALLPVGDGVSLFTRRR